MAGSQLVGFFMKSACHWGFNRCYIFVTKYLTGAILSGSESSTQHLYFSKFVYLRIDAVLLGSISQTFGVTYRCRLVVYMCVCIYRCRLVVYVRVCIWTVQCFEEKNIYLSLFLNRHFMFIFPRVPHKQDDI